MMMAVPAKIQNEERAIMEEAEPNQKATALVKDVIVIEGPACDMPSDIRSSVGLLMSV